MYRLFRLVAIFEAVLDFLYVLLYFFYIILGITYSVPTADFPIFIKGKTNTFGKLKTLTINR